MKIINNQLSIIIQSLLAMLMATFSCSESCYLGAVEVQIKNQKSNIKNTEWQLEQELPTIKAAAERNKCRGDDFLILLAIRKAENGGPGKEFGIKYWLCRAAINKRPAESLDIQAGWAAATIVKNRRRWKEQMTDDRQRTTDDFINFLGNRYCPTSVDSKGNENWKINVKYFYKRLATDEHGLTQCNL